MSSKSIAWLDGLVEPVDASPAVLLDQEEEFVAHPYMEKIIGVSSFQIYFMDGQPERQGMTSKWNFLCC